MTAWDSASFFLKNGYLRASRVLPEDLLARVDRVVEREFVRGAPPTRVNASGELTRLDKLFDRDPVFTEVLRHPVVSEPLQAVLGPDVELLSDRHNQAALNRAGDIPFRLHRDVQHWSRAVVSVFVYLDASTTANGCTHVVPGSHTLPYAGPQSNHGGGTWADEYGVYSHLENQHLPVPMPRGGVLLIDGLTFHSVGVNTTDQPRRSMVFACHSCDDLLDRARETREILYGTRTYRGNSGQQVSGSLNRSPSEAEAR